MIGALTARRLVTVGMLTAMWCALWGDISAANVLGGVLLGFAVSSPMLATPQLGKVNLVALVKLMGFVAADLARSTAAVAIETLTPTDSTDESIVAVSVPPEARGHFMFLVVAITLTPGSAVVDIDTESSTLYLHLLHDDRDGVVEHTRRLAELVCEALPTPAESGANR